MSVVPLLLKSPTAKAVGLEPTKTAGIIGLEEVYAD
jgi:hypothetical protein